MYLSDVRFFKKTLSALFLFFCTQKKRNSLRALANSWGISRRPIKRTFFFLNIGVCAAYNNIINAAVGLKYNAAADYRKPYGAGMLN